MEEKEIFLYTISTCSHCKDTKRFLTENNISYDYIDVDMLDREIKKDIMEEVKKLNPRVTFPTIKIGETVIIGFKKNDIKEALGL